MVDNNSAIEETVRTYLASQGGSVEDPEGRGLTDEMARAIGVERPLMLNAVLRQMEGDGVITRDVRGLLTYRIALVGDDPGQAPPAAESRKRKNGAARKAPSAAPDVEPAADASLAGGTGAAAVESVATAPPSEPVTTDVTGSEVSGADATDKAEVPSEEKPVSLREALARRGKPPTRDAPAVPSTAGLPATPPVDAPASLSSPPTPSPDATATLPVASPAPPAVETTATKPAAETVAPPSSVPDAESPLAAPQAAPAGGRSRGSRLREAQAAKSAAEVVEADEGLRVGREEACMAPPSPSAPGAVTDAPVGPSGTPPLGSATDAPPGSPPAGGHFAGLWDSAAPPPPAPPVTAVGPAGGPASTSRFATADSGRSGRGSRLRSRLDNPVQEVKAPPSTTTITAVGVALAGLVLIAIISAIVSRTTTHPSPNNSFSASTDACHVVTSADATAVLGGDAGQPHFVLGTCVYDNGSSELIVAVFRQQARAMFDAARSDSAQDVANIGDAAYFVDGRLRVMKGTNLLELTESPVPQNAPNAAMLALATTAVGRL